MKRLYYIATLAIALFASVPMQAQEEAGNAQQQQQRRRGPVSSRGAREEDKKESCLLYTSDSIIRERLADPAYGGNDLFKITEDRYGEPVTPHLDWSRPIPWKRANEDEIRAIESVYTCLLYTSYCKRDIANIFKSPVTPAYAGL